VLRTMPPRASICHETPENFAWSGRVSAVIENWDKTKAIILLPGHMDQFLGIDARGAAEGFRKLMTLLHQARHDLRMETLGPVNVAIPHRMTFEYFDEIRKAIEIAKQDVLFVDPYLDAEFVSRYFGHVAAGTTTRLHAREKLPSLLPAVDAYVQQFKAKVEVRSAPNFHDRYIFVDGVVCYQSGASFKDGAKWAPTTLTQITDAFAAVSQTYEDM